MGRLKYYRYHAAPPGRRTPLLIRTSGVVFLLLTLRFLLLQLSYQEALKSKYTATNFGALQLIDVDRTNLEARRQNLLTARPEWRQLGHGFEGSTFIWQDRVIKTFNAARSPFRNCVPLADDDAETQYSTGQSRWPTEIPASLLLGGEPGRDDNTVSGFLAVTDFFRAASPDEGSLEWHLVTPLMSDGTLLDLGRKAFDNNEFFATREVDLFFRRSFVDLLSTLKELHSRGLCHDDIKPANIFIGEDARWLLGDLGNVREITHPYHGSKIWNANHQVPDCRANDVLRAVKTYLLFLRAASDHASFDMMLFEAKEPWARLFWMSAYAGPALSAAELQHWSEDTERPEHAPHYVSQYERLPKRLWNPLLRLWYGKTRVMQQAADEALELNMGEGWARAIAMTAFFGVPTQSCP